MRRSRTPSARPAPAAKGAPLTPEQRRQGERNLVHLLIIAHDQGVPAALREWDRMLEEKLAKAQNSPPEPKT